MSKTINISRFSLGGDKKKDKLEKKPRKKNISSKIKQNANEVRERLLQKLKDKSIEKTKQNVSEKNTDNATEKGEQTSQIAHTNMFQDTTKFLDGLIEKRNKRKEILKTRERNTQKNRHTIKNNSDKPAELGQLHNKQNPSLIIKNTIIPPYTKRNQPTQEGGGKQPRRPSLKMKRHPISLSNVEEFELKPDPPFGVLKNGKKKTYRQYYNKPLQININDEERPISPILVPPPTPIKSNIVNDDIFLPETRSDKLERYKKTLPKKKRSYTIKRKFKLGFNKTTNSISFMKKNKTMKINYLKTINDICSVPLSDKKIFLRKKGLLTTGSELPNDLLCEMYKDAILCGDISNEPENDLNIKIE